MSIFCELNATVNGTNYYATRGAGSIKASEVYLDHNYLAMSLLHSIVIMPRMGPG